MSVSDTVLHLGVDGDIRSSSSLSSGWCSGLLTDGHRSGLDSTVIQGDTLRGNSVTLWWRSHCSTLDVPRKNSNRFTGSVASNDNCIRGDYGSWYSDGATDVVSDVGVNGNKSTGGHRHSGWGETGLAVRCQSGLQGGR